MESTAREERERIRKERLKILDEQVEIWNSNCMKCTKISEAIKDGILSKGVCKDRPNVICEQCPAHYLLRDIGDKLHKLTVQDRRLRK